MRVYSASLRVVLWKFPWSFQWWSLARLSEEQNRSPAIQWVDDAIAGRFGCVGMGMVRHHVSIMFLLYVLLIIDDNRVQDCGDHGDFAWFLPWLMNINLFGAPFCKLRSRRLRLRTSSHLGSQELGTLGNQSPASCDRFSRLRQFARFGAAKLPRQSAKKIVFSSSYFVPLLFDLRSRWRQSVVQSWLASEVSSRAQCHCITSSWPPGWMRPSGSQRTWRPTWKLNLGMANHHVWPHVVRLTGIGVQTCSDLLRYLYFI